MGTKATATSITSIRTTPHTVFSGETLQCGGNVIFNTEMYMLACKKIDLIFFCLRKKIRTDLPYRQGWLGGCFEASQLEFPSFQLLYKRNTNWRTPHLFCYKLHLCILFSSIFLPIFRQKNIQHIFPSPPRVSYLWGIRTLQLGSWIHIEDTRIGEATVDWVAPGGIAKATIGGWNPQGQPPVWDGAKTRRKSWDKLPSSTGAGFCPSTVLL